ncbi:hypothetical protein BG015_001474 [Linnemannia schmuckeri]|uniref:Uncharacterized protein n=1 Tax=Linnemannia schmuckeri TaxID=64567 RepID=A0A9P5V6W9_9FUNG|nr:hypothetical protein BG015_001474 [Linnemannia schmuckeri]
MNNSHNKCATMPTRPNLINLPSHSNNSNNSNNNSHNTRATLVPQMSSTTPNNQQPPLTINTSYYNNGPYSDEQRVSPVGSGGSGGSNGSGNNHSGGSGSGGGSVHRRSSLADIPKTLFSSLRRGSHFSSSEIINSNKESIAANYSGSASSQQQYQQQQQRAEERIGSPASSYEDDDSNSSASGGDGEDDQDYGRQENEFQQQQPDSATILTANGLMQATMAVPKGPPPSYTTMVSHLSPVPVKSILKKRSPPSSPAQQQQQPYTKMRLNIINMSSSYDVHPMAASDGQMGGLLRATDHRARLETNSPIPSHPQLMQSQQLQQQTSKKLRKWTPAPKGIQPLQCPTTPAHYNGYGPYGERNLGNTTTAATTVVPLKLGSTVELDDHCLSHGGSGGDGAVYLADFTPGMQSNVYQDRGGERSQGQVLDCQMMEIDPSLSFPGITVPPPPVADVAIASGARGYQHHPSYSRAHDQDYYDGANGVYAGNDQNSFSMDEAQYPMTTMMHERDGGYGYKSNGEGNYYGSMRNSSKTSESAVEGILSDNGISHHRSRTIGFTEMIEIIPAHRKSEYNRRSYKHATFKNLTPDLKSEIRDELNTYKMREMAVHVESMGNTAFH